MARPERITREFLVRGMQAGKTNEQMAQELGVNPSSINNKKRKLRLTVPQLDHSWAKPWPIEPRHKKSTIAQYLDELSRAAQTDNFEGSTVRAAANWALELVEEENDITYDHGWVVVKANPTNWHIRMVLEAAISGELPEGR